ncbi:MAG TPA: DUF4214 domain-containing protein [Pyrinomonadaceae bacterium]|nr:DUF4214 domain-containing protein [Pyrinomonadaceae bacterium]
MVSKRFSLYFLLLLQFVAGAALAPSASAQTAATQKRRVASTEQVRGTRQESARSAAVNFLELERQEAVNPEAGRIKLTAIEEPERQLEENLPVPDFGAAAAAPAGQGPIEPLGASPELASSFLASDDALNDNQFNIPPDTHGAVGPNHLVVVVNGRVRIQSKTGALLSTVGLKTFWSRLYPGRPVGDIDAFDPKILYDPYGQRWMITTCVDRDKPESAVLIGVSQTSDPTGGWFLYSTDADAANLVWADYPSMGFNKNWIVVQMNMFSIGGANFSSTGRLYVFDKAQLYAGPSSIGVTAIPITSGFTVSPAATYDPNLETLYMVQNWNGANGSLRVSSINKVGGVPVFTPLSFPVASNFTWNSTAEVGGGTPDFAPQKDSDRKIQTFDNRMQGVVYRNGSLWCAQTVFLPASGPTRSTVQWWQLNPAAQAGVAVAPLQRGLVDPSGTDWYAFPSIAVNKNNDVLIGYTRFSAARYPSANYSFRAGTDPANSLRDDAVLKAGESFYYKTFGATQNRWGDYSATVVDPSNDLDLWTIQEYAAARSTSRPEPSDNNSRWGTWWGRIALGPSANPIDDAEFFVRQHYSDFLNRAPDDSGLAFWTANITSCGADAQCREVKRIDTSAAYFLSGEFQETGYLVYRAYKAAFGDIPGKPVPLTLAEFLPDTQRVGQGVVIGQPGAETLLESNKAAYANEFVARPRFASAYPSTMSSTQFVDKLNANSGNSLTQSERDALISQLSSGAKSRAQVLRAVAENSEFTRRERNRAFVLSQYFGYLRRNPDDAPNTDFAGYNFWLGKLDQFGGDFRAAEMVKSFIISGEYRQRFGL